MTVFLRLRPSVSWVRRREDTWAGMMGIGMRKGLLSARSFMTDLVVGGEGRLEGIADAPIQLKRVTVLNELGRQEEGNGLIFGETKSGTYVRQEARNDHIHRNDYHIRGFDE